MKCRIFLDTNVLEIPKPNFFDFKISGLFKDIEILNKYDDLDIEFIIPKIVVCELEQHYIEKYKNSKDKLLEHENAYSEELKKFNLQIEKKSDVLINLDEYKNVLKTQVSDYFTNINCLVIENLEMAEYKNIENKALKKVPPFFGSNKTKKKYSDAGFKDAVFLETIEKFIRINQGESVKNIIISGDELLKSACSNYDFILLKPSENKEDNLKTIENYFTDILKLKIDISFLKFLEKGENSYLYQKIQEKLEIKNELTFTISNYDDDEGVFTLEFFNGTEKYRVAIEEKAKEFLSLYQIVENNETNLIESW